MINRMHELEKRLNNIEYNQLWNGFSKTKYALYDDQNFYINDREGICIDLMEEDSFFKGKTDERFVGNTAILMDDHYIAIWNIGMTPEGMDNDELASLIAHEMFHCFQFSNGEKRFPNDLMGVDYPITIENMSLRTLEREYLLDASMETDIEKKMESLTHYFNIRNKRERLIGDILKYEKAIESVEGVAVYVEFKALTQLSKYNKITSLKKYVKGFTDVNEKNFKIRHSSYRQGLLLGLIADAYIPDWKDRFMNSELFLSDFIQRELDIKEMDLEYKYENKSLIVKQIDNWINLRDSIFDEFNKEGKRNILEEGFQITGFDPMNVIKRNDEVIHINFLRVQIDNKEQVIPGPVKATIGSNIFDVKRIQW